MQLEEPVECASGDDPLLLYKILYLLFFPLVRILCALRLESRKKFISMVLMRDLWNFSFFGRGDVSPTHSELCRFVSGWQAKHQVSSPVIILFKKNLSASANAIMSWQTVTRSSLCSVSISVEQNVHKHFSFPNLLSKFEELHSWGYSKILLRIILDVIRWSFLTKSATAAMFTSVRVDFGRPPLS